MCAFVLEESNVHQVRKRCSMYVWYFLILQLLL